jgi:3-methyl-2-oxobutanoate hydroxymethyltransferase
MGKKKRISDFLEMKEKGEKVAAIVTYTKPNANLAEEAEMDWLLAPGDSVGPSLLEYDSTVPVTMDEVMLFAKAVRKGAPKTFRVGDMTFGSYTNPVDAIANAVRFHKEAGVDMVKLEGGRCAAEVIKEIVKNGMKVMGHIGLTPQTAGFGEGYIVQGETAESAIEVILDARAVEKAGASAILLEAIPSELGKIITEELKIPVFGIGAGSDVDGQLLLDVDLLGLSTVFNPTFVKCFVSQAIKAIERENYSKYVNGGTEISEISVNFANITLYAFKEYVKEVKAGIFPAEEHCYHMKSGEYNLLLNWLEKEKERTKIPNAI